MKKLRDNQTEELFTGASGELQNFIADPVGTLASAPEAALGALTQAADPGGAGNTEDQASENLPTSVNAMDVFRQKNFGGGF
jgi:hypothetical protein